MKGKSGSDPDFLLTEDRGAVRVLTMNRPDKRNALNTALTRQLLDGLRAADAADSVAAVVLTGAGNSAGQATVFLAGKVKKLWMIVRGKDLETTMSQYLIDRIRALPNVEVVLRHEICGLEGTEGNLQRVRLKCRDTGVETGCEIGHIFSFIGAEPNTHWLTDSGIQLDDKGFVITGAAGRHFLATNCDGVFAVGDVRCGSVKRVAAAVGEGSTVVSAIHAFLAEQRAVQEQKAAAE